MSTKKDMWAGSKMHVQKVKIIWIFLKSEYFYIEGWRLSLGMHKNISSSKLAWNFKI